MMVEREQKRKKKGCSLMCLQDRTSLSTGTNHVYLHHPHQPWWRRPFCLCREIARAARHMKKLHLGKQKCKLYAAQAVPWYFGKGSPTLLLHGKCEKHDLVFAWEVKYPKPQRCKTGSRALSRQLSEYPWAWKLGCIYQLTWGLFYVAAQCSVRHNVVQK